MKGDIHLGGRPERKREEGRLIHGLIDADLIFRRMWDDGHSVLVTTKYRATAR